MQTTPRRNLVNTIEHIITIAASVRLRRYGKLDVTALDKSYTDGWVWLQPRIDDIGPDQKLINEYAMELRGALLAHYHPSSYEVITETHPASDGQSHIIRVQIHT
jgi:hypothetical protein